MRSIKRIYLSQEFVYVSVARTMVPSSDGGITSREVTISDMDSSNFLLLKGGAPGFAESYWRKGEGLLNSIVPRLGTPVG